LLPRGRRAGSAGDGADGDAANGDAATVERPRPGAAPGLSASRAVPPHAMTPGHPGVRSAAPTDGAPPEGTPTDSTPTAQLPWSGPQAGTERSGYAAGPGATGSAADSGSAAGSTGSADSAGWAGSASWVGSGPGGPSGAGTAAPGPAGAGSLYAGSVDPGGSGTGVTPTAEYPVPAAEAGRAAPGPEWRAGPPTDGPDGLPPGEPAYGRPLDAAGLAHDGRGSGDRWRAALHATMVWTRRLIVCAVITVMLSPLLVAFRVWYVARQDSTPRSDAVIVLGAAQYNGQPSPVFQWRLRHAARLYKEGVAPVVVTVGGGQPGDRFTEAGSGRKWLAEHGVPASKIVAVGTGANTEESLVAAGREFRRHDWNSAVLVSDPWHALRTRTMARDQGIEAETSPTRSGPIVQTRGTQARYIIRETGAYLNYILGRD
jgi:uncharacterized SAM-binding protein YcdF (DUF218 family)